MRYRLALLLATSIPACEPAPVYVAGEPGTPLPGLSEAELGQFHAGQAEFNRIFTPETGLGPAFNENQCSACHTVPAAGGTTGFERIVKATRYEGPGACDLLSDDGGENVRSQLTPAARASGMTPEAVPARATEVGRFLPTFLFGLGLVEAIPEETILARADPDDRNGDGISGRAARLPDGRLGRFGRKGDIATIDQFTRSALRLEMGLTTHETDVDLVSGAPPPASLDPAAEPEVDARSVDLLTAFIRFLAPPARSPPRSEAHADTLDGGERLFRQVGCTGCHTPEMRAGPHVVEALADKTIRLWSDLLLHDLGPGLANVCAVDASPTELRTAPLMGLGHRQFLLHDGRATDIREAILSHGGEAQAARDAFARLPWLAQEYIVMFLRSL
jgi:CxxC motif-containing protein (DUF1111 family)